MLKDLNSLAQRTKSNIQENVFFSEVYLTEEFKEAYSEYLNISGKSIDFFSSTSQYKNESGQTISFPNTWFLISYYLVEYYTSLIEYKEKFTSIFLVPERNRVAEELFKIQDKLFIPADIASRIDSFFNEEMDRDNFKKFLINNYSWWYGQKKVDRGDFYLTAILKVANLINDSSSFIGTITKDFATNPKLYSLFEFNKKEFAFTGVVDGAEFKLEPFLQSLKASGLTYPSNIVLRFILSLLTKPFIVLTGLSGSGKTKIALAFAKWITETDNQICIVPVGADWTNREPLLGYPNALESRNYVLPENGVLNLIIEANKPENETKPYFLILDEMNLSHVERYFADFLSSMESSVSISLHVEYGDWKDAVPAKVKLPKNLFIIGTVNIDETTYMFSPKVLDRANVIEFRVSETDMTAYLNNRVNLNMNALNNNGSSMAESFISLAKDENITVLNAEELNTTLVSYFKELQKVGAEFGYRTAAEITRFAAITNKIEPSWQTNEIIDAAIMQKILPKVHGSRRKLESVLKKLGELCILPSEEVNTILNKETIINYSDREKIKYPISLEKIKRMFQGLLDNGFTSYAEA